MLAELQTRLILQMKAYVTKVLLLMLIMENLLQEQLRTLYIRRMNGSIDGPVTEPIAVNKGMWLVRRKVEKCGWLNRIWICIFVIDVRAQHHINQRALQSVDGASQSITLLMFE